MYDVIIGLFVAAVGFGLWVMYKKFKAGQRGTYEIELQSAKRREEYVARWKQLEAEHRHKHNQEKT